jgi:hypothetical protein
MSSVFVSRQLRSASDQMQIKNVVHSARTLGTNDHHTLHRQRTFDEFADYIRRSFPDIKLSNVDTLRLHTNYLYGWNYGVDHAVSSMAYRFQPVLK